MQKLAKVVEILPRINYPHAHTDRVLEVSDARQNM